MVSRDLGPQQLCGDNIRTENRLGTDSEEPVPQLEGNDMLISLYVKLL